LRSSESLDAKIVYLLENPVRAGLVREWMDYPWLWKKPSVNPLLQLCREASEKSWAAPCGQPGRLSPHKQFCYSRPRVCGGCHLRAGMFSKYLRPFQTDQRIEWRIGLPSAADQADIILLFGGDGTIHRQLSQLVKLKLPVLIVPAGAGMTLLARWAGRGARFD